MKVLGLSFLTITLSFLFGWARANGQNLGKCTFTDLADGSTRFLPFSIFITQPSDSVYSKRYLISDEGHTPFEVVNLSNNNSSRVISIETINLKNGKKYGQSINYSAFGGLLINDENSDSVQYLKNASAYNYLISFDSIDKKSVSLYSFTQPKVFTIQFSQPPDTLLQFNRIYLLQMKLAKQKYIEQQAAEEKLRVIDSIVKIRVNLALKQKILLESQTQKTDTNDNSPHPIKLKQDASRTVLNLISLMDSCYKKYYQDSLAAWDTRNRINKDLTNSVYGDYIYNVTDVVGRATERYAGDMKMNKPEGSGLMLGAGSVYDGRFVAGKFVSGNAIIRNSLYQYFGHYNNVNGKLNGTGWKQILKNGDYYLGEFQNEQLISGTAFIQNNQGVYWGSYNNNVMSGYGEMQYKSGNTYYGLFENNECVVGFETSVDNMGYKFVFFFNHGSKIVASDSDKQLFFSKRDLAKQKP